MSGEIERRRAKTKLRVGLGDGDAGVVDLGRQPALAAEHAVLHVDGGDVEVVAGIERDGDAGWCRRCAGGLDVAHPWTPLIGCSRGMVTADSTSCALAPM